jgi:hypothetical protein
MENLISSTCFKRFNSNCRTCSSAATHYEHIVIIDDAAISSFSSQLNSKDVVASAFYTRPPIRFDSLSEELDYMCLGSLLDFGSGYDHLLKATPDKPAASSHSSVSAAAEFAVLGMAMQDSLPDAATMAEYPRHQLAGAYNIDPTVEAEVMPGVTMTSPGPLSPLLASIQQVLNETGRCLLEKGHSSLGAFVLSVVEEREKSGQAPSAAYAVEQLVETLKFGFNDEFDSVENSEKEENGAGFGAQTIVWHRKAQQFVGRIYLRFAKSDARFDFKDIDELSLDSSEIMVAVLVKKGILKLSAELEAKIEAGEDLKNGVSLLEVAAMRAAAVEAGKRICEEAKKNDGGGSGKTFAPRHLSAYLLRQAETEEEFKDLKVHVNTATVAY